MASVVMILIVTLFPTGEGAPAAVSPGLGRERRDLSDAILNFFLFVPFGIAVAGGGRSVLVAGLGGVMLASLIEVTQTILPGRDPALSDIVFNASGAVAGALVALHRRRWLNPNPRTALTFSSVSLLGAVLVVVGTGRLLSPLPSTPFGGSTQLVLAKSSSASLREVEAVLVLDVPSAEQGVLIGRSGNDLVLRYPSRGAAYGFDQPDYRENGLFEKAAAGDSGIVSFSRDRSRWDIAVDRNRATIGPTPGLGWALSLIHI